MVSGNAANLDEHIEVHFSGLGGCWIVLAVVPILWCFGSFPDQGVRLWFSVPLAVLLTYGLLLVAATFVRSNPIMILAPEGIYLPVAGEVFLTYDRVEIWATRLDRKLSSRTVSLQGRPRVQLNISWWAWIRNVRVNTLVYGDLLLDERFINISAIDLKQAIEARRQAAH